MSDIRLLIQNYVKKARVMQLATSADNKPWVCNLHFYADEDLDFYWISTLDRRHSKEIVQNQYVAAAIKIHEDTPEEPYVIGISIEGTAALLDKRELKKIGSHYVRKLHKPANLLEDILSGNNPHKFYRLKTEKIVLFDNKNFPENPREELVL